MSYYKQLGDQPATRIPAPFARTIRTVFNAQDGAGEFTVATSAIEPNARTGGHRHAGSAELMYILSGTGQARVGDQSFAVQPETIFFAPANVEHEIVNTGTEILNVLAVYAPPVPADFAAQARAAAEHQRSEE